jgi:hypothetical protein
MVPWFMFYVLPLPSPPLTISPPLVGGEGEPAPVSDLQGIKLCIADFISYVGQWLEMGGGGEGGIVWFNQRPEQIYLLYYCTHVCIYICVSNSRDRR